MNVLIIQEKGRHAKNWQYRESLSFKNSFTRIGVNSDVWGLGYDNFDIPFQDIEKDYDVIFLLENYERDNWVPDLTTSKKLKVFWSIDSHCSLPAHEATCEKHDIDLVLNSTSYYVPMFEAKGRKCVWFPNAYPLDLIKPLDVEKNCNVGFCGNYCNRKDWIDAIDQEVGVKRDIFVIGDDMVRAINGYRIHFNRNIANDINYRTFETLGCGTFLLTNRTDRLDELLKDGEHLVVYDGIRDCISKVKYYLDHEDERETIALKGHKYVRGHHTYDNRAQRFVDIVEGL